MYLPMKIWLWTNVAVDIVIVTALTYNLVGMRRGFNKKTDDLINSLIRLSFETCAMPLFVALFSAILYEIASHPSMKTVGNWTSAPISECPREDATESEHNSKEAEVSTDSPPMPRPHS